MCVKIVEVFGLSFLQVLMVQLPEYKSMHRSPHGESFAPPPAPFSFLFQTWKLDTVSRYNKTGE